ERARKGTERMIDALLAAVASLAPSEEMIVSWRFFDSRTAEEIATHLRVHDNTVRNRRARALDRLCQKLQPLRLELEEQGVEFLPAGPGSFRKKSRSSGPAFALAPASLEPPPEQSLHSLPAVLFTLLVEPLHSAGVLRGLDGHRIDDGGSVRCLPERRGHD